MKYPEKGGLVERGLRWDVGFNRKLGVAATVLAAGAAAISAPVVATGLALFAGGNFVAAEVEKRAADSLTKHRLGTDAVKRSDFDLAA